ncbi:hypothetical protein WHR41_00771 [Cladosporium halotolerans]|uniref:Uncharacterized protein n=1 Tax=Cladosporium halotolerans TaxID=1052096 RepID=A0AB34L2N7_9PEZI
MSHTIPQGYITQNLEGRYIRPQVLEAFLRANAITFGAENRYDATSTKGIIVVVVKRELTKPEIYDLQKESYPKKFQDGPDSD